MYEALKRLRKENARLKEEGRDRLIAEAEGVDANTLLLNFNREAMSHTMFMEQLRRFGAEVLPALQAHPVTKIPV